MKRSGRCLCGAVRYEIEGELPPLVNCHCQFCRRAHGAAFVTIGWLPRSSLKITAGEESLARSVVGDGYRCFCKECGTRLFNAATNEEGFMSLIVATLDDQDLPGPVLHYNLESKAPWTRIDDDLPQFERFGPDLLEYLRKLAKQRKR